MTKTNYTTAITSQNGQFAQWQPSAKNTTLQVQFATQKDAEHASRMYDEGLGCINTYYAAMLDVADSLMVDCISELRRKGMYKLKVKHCTKRAKDLSDSTGKMLRKNLKQELYFDMLDAFQDTMRRDVAVLQEHVTQSLHKLGIDHARFKAKFETVGLVLTIAMKVFQDIGSDANREAHHNVAQYWQYLKPDHILKWWKEALPLIVAYPDSLREQLFCDKQLLVCMANIEEHVATKDETDRVLVQLAETHPEILEEYAANNPDVSFEELKEYIHNKAKNQ